MAEGKVVGHGPCPHCGIDLPYKLNKKNHLYVYCKAVPDGGCLSSTIARSDVSDVSLARRITKWTDPEQRTRFKGDAAEKPEKAEASPKAKSGFLGDIL